MRILIIGVNGFLGSHLFDYYEKKGYFLFSASYRPDNSDSNIRELERVIKENNIDLIINAGASQDGGDSVAALKGVINSNVYFPSAIASILIRSSPKTCFINFGSSWQIDETGNQSPFNAYAASKSAAECFYDHFALSGLRIATLRLYDTYGPLDKRNKVINLIAEALLKSLPLDLTAGQQAVDFVHISDVISAVDIVIEELFKLDAGLHLKYSVRSFSVISVACLLELMRDLYNKDKPDSIRLGVREYRGRERFILSEDSLPTPPGWLPKIELKDGLIELLKD